MEDAVFRKQSGGDQDSLLSKNKSRARDEKRKEQGQRLVLLLDDIFTDREQTQREKENEELLYGEGWVPQEKCQRKKQ